MVSHAKGVLAMINTKRQPPVSPATLPVLMDAIADRRSTGATVAAVVSHDPGLAARVLALANSSPFGLSRRVTELSQAITIVGTGVVQTLAIANAVVLVDTSGIVTDAYDHGVRVAIAARLLAPAAGVQPADAFAAGLLHDIGELLLLQDRPTEYAGLHATFETHAHQLRSEKQAFGTDHALVGAEHLLDWRVPDVIADAVADHHDPYYTSSPTTIVVAAADELISAEAGRHHALDLLELDVAAADGLRQRVALEAADLAGLFGG
jgi:putative nucleotidyltransferase with HDIG domain